MPSKKMITLDSCPSPLDLRAQTPYSQQLTLVTYWLLTQELNGI